MIEVGTTFMARGQEYRIVHKNEEKNRISIEPIGKITDILQLNEKLEIDNLFYKVMYIKEKQKRVALDLIRKVG